MPNPRKPQSLKILQGTDQPVRRRSEPAFPVADISEAPDWLIGPVAVELWHRLGKELVETGVLRRPHLEMFGHFCNMHARCVKKWRLEAEPTAAELAQLKAYAGSFGVTPESASRVMGAGVKEDENPFANLAKSS